MTDPEVKHVTGYKDDYKVVIRMGGEEWAPTLEETFDIVDKWFVAEDHAFGDGLGARMPLMYVCLIALGHMDEVQEACELEGHEILDHYKECQEKYGDEIKEYLGI